VRFHIRFAFCILHFALAVAPPVVFAQGRGPVDTSKAISRIVDPPDGKIPYQQWAQEKRLGIPTFRRGESSRVVPLDATRPHLPASVKLSMGAAVHHQAAVCEAEPAGRFRDLRRSVRRGNPEHRQGRLLSEVGRVPRRST